MSALPDHIDATQRITCSYVANNPVSPADLPKVIASIYDAIVGLGVVQSTEPTTTWPGKVPTPLTPREIKALITPDAIISLEDGKPYKMLRRHLSIIGLTPEQYREKWGLPDTFPMTAPNYSAQRSSLAKATGLGKKR